jgi:hypothetical protein
LVAADETAGCVIAITAIAMPLRYSISWRTAP